MSWSLYTEKMKEALKNPLFCGAFSKAKPGMRLVIGNQKRGSSRICFYWIVDEEDGVISDIAYQVIGESALVAFVEITASLLIRKTYDQASRVSSELIEKTAGIKEPCKDWDSLYNHILLVIDEMVETCFDIPFVQTYEDTPLSLDGEAEILEDWPLYPLEKKLALIEKTLEEKIRPYIELDAGGVEIIRLSDKEELTIRYLGNCTGCYASTGSTLSAIQNILQTYLHPSIQVIPEL